MGRIVSEMTYIVSSGTLNLTVPYCIITSYSDRFSLGELFVLCALLSPHADRHAGDISFTGFFYVTLFAKFCNGYLWRGLKHGDEIWQNGRPGWVAGHLLFW